MKLKSLSVKKETFLYLSISAGHILRVMSITTLSIFVKNHFIIKYKIKAKNQKSLDIGFYTNHGIKSNSS